MGGIYQKKECGVQSGCVGVNGVTVPYVSGMVSATLQETTKRIGDVER